MMAALKQLRNSTWPYGDIQRQSRRNHQDVKMVIVKNMVWWTSLLKHVLHQSLLRTEVALLMFRRINNEEPLVGTMWWCDGKSSASRQSTRTLGICWQASWLEGFNTSQSPWKEHDATMMQWWFDFDISVVLLLTLMLEVNDDRW